MTRLCSAIAFIGLAARAAAATPSSVDDVVSLVRSALEARQDDKQIAKSLAKVKLSENLDEQTVEELESAGTGPKALEELERMRDLSAEFPKPAAAPAFAEPPVPPRAEMQRIVGQAREYALNYSQALPDFICTQIVHRFEDLRGKGEWKLKDTLTVRLSILDSAESYKLVAINSRPTTLSYDESVRGAVSQGEFKSMLLQVFDPSTQAQIRWDHWTHLRKRAVQVYSYRINVANSRYQIAFGAFIGDQTSAMAGLRGLIYVDPETSRIVRVTNEATDLPAGFPVKIATSALDYEFAEVGGRRYLLPLRADIRLGTTQLHTKNVVEFTAFRKFAGESTISFDTDPAAIKDPVVKDPAVKKQ